jgi:hypothetical protein
LGWSHLVKGSIEVYDTPGYHGAMVRDPWAASLARLLDEVLIKAQKRLNAYPTSKVG